MGRRRRGPGASHPGIMGNPFKSRNPVQDSLRQNGIHPRKARKTLAEQELVDRNSVRSLLEGEQIRAADGYIYEVVSRFPDGSVRIRRSVDGALGSLKAGDSINLVSESPLRGFLP